MQDRQCVRFLQWALPQLHMKWSGFRKVRRQVCKRLDRRLRDLGLADVDAYRSYLDANADEWQRLDAMCRITISRFYRDRVVFATLAQQVLPALAGEVRTRDDTFLRIWSAGCGSGEEAYTLSILWERELQRQFPDTTIEIVATDADTGMVDRAREARYGSSSLKDLPKTWRDVAFEREGAAWRLKPRYRPNVHFYVQDIRRTRPEGLFDLVLCRNLVFTYYDDGVQAELLNRFVGAMRPGAALVIGAHERLPEDAGQLSTWFDTQRIFRKAHDPRMPFQVQT